VKKIEWQHPESEDQDLRSDESAFTRREFMVATSAAAATTTLLLAPGCERREPPEAPEAGTTPLPEPEAFDSHNRYRAMWSWDGAVRTTHNVNCGNQQNCCFNVYVKDGRVVREEQVAQYPRTNDRVPDFNPRGCQKGCSYSELMYSVPRLTHPLRRVGERGSGRWEKVSWDEALTAIADQIVSTIQEVGPYGIVIDSGSDLFANSTWLGLLGFADMVDATLLDAGGEVGDEQQGVSLTYGSAVGGRSADDYFYSDLVLIWSGNPVYTQIPHMHFLTEARYHGATIVCISPDLNASAIHTDLWVPIRPGTDTALAMGIAKVLVEEGLTDAALLREQTDLPCLVREDDGKLLRESDLVPRGSDEQLYQYDLERGEVFAIDHEALALGEHIPVLEGRYRVETLEGRVWVRPVFELLKQALALSTLEDLSRACDVPPPMIRRLARMMAEAKAATNVVTTAMSKFYHGDLGFRSQILTFVLAGHLGGKGSGFDSAQYLFPDGGSEFYTGTNLARELRWPLLKKHGLPLAVDYLSGVDMDRRIHRLYEDLLEESKLVVNGTLFWNLHAGLYDVTRRYQDPTWKRELDEYVAEAEEKNWDGLQDVKQLNPKIFFSWAGNSLRRVRRGDEIRRTLWPKLDLVVALDVRMSSTAMHADYVLPILGVYERNETIGTFSPSAVPFHHTMNAAVEPQGDSLNEWQVVCGLAKKIEQRCRARGFSKFTSRRGKPRRLDNVYEVLTHKSRYTENDTEKMSKVVIEESSNLGGIRWDELKKTGFVRFTGIGNHPIGKAQASDIPSDDTISAHTWHTEKKKPWFTLSGRVQFYIDHDWYLEMGEQLPTYKAPPMAGGNHPIALTGGHTRWSIHALQRSDPLLLRLQRGQPCMWVNPNDAAHRRVEDGDRIRVWNDLGEFTTMAKLSPSVRPGQAVMYHAWESYQFEGWVGYRNILASPLKPLELVGDIPYHKQKFIEGRTGMSDRDTRIDYAKA
jgi:DMSO reductase family type II enzyme molybdopterin subunit